MNLKHKFDCHAAMFILLRLCSQYSTSTPNLTRINDADSWFQWDRKIVCNQYSAISQRHSDTELCCKHASTIPAVGLGIDVGVK